MHLNSDDAALFAVLLSTGRVTDAGGGYVRIRTPQNANFEDLARAAVRDVNVYFGSPRVSLRFGHLHFSPEDAGVVAFLNRAYRVSSRKPDDEQLARLRRGVDRVGDPSFAEVVGISAAGRVAAGRYCGLLADGVLIHFSPRPNPARARASAVALGFRVDRSVGLRTHRRLSPDIRALVAVAEARTRRTTPLDRKTTLRRAAELLVADREGDPLSMARVRAANAFMPPSAMRSHPDGAVVSDTPTLRSVVAPTYVSTFARMAHDNVRECEQVHQVNVECLAYLGSTREFALARANPPAAEGVVKMRVVIHKRAQNPSPPFFWRRVAEEETLAVWIPQTLDVSAEKAFDGARTRDVWCVTPL